MMIFSAILLLILGVPSNLLVIVLGLQFLILLVSVVATLSNGDYQLETDNKDDTGEPSAPEYAVVDDGKVKAIEYQGFVRNADALSSTNAGDSTPVRMLLSENDFNGFKGTIKHLRKLLRRMSRDKTFFDQVMGIAKDRDAISSDFGDENIYFSLTLYLFKDIKYCCDHLNVSDDMDFNTAIGQALLEFTVLIFREKDVEYEDYGYFKSVVIGKDEINEGIKSTLQETYIYSRDQNEVNITSKTIDDFMLVMMLDATDGQHYITEMRKWLNRLAKQIATPFTDKECLAMITVDDVAAAIVDNP